MTLFCEQRDPPVAQRLKELGVNLSIVGKATIQERVDGGTLGICGWFVGLASRLWTPINCREGGDKEEWIEKRNEG